MLSTLDAADDRFIVHLKITKLHHHHLLNSSYSCNCTHTWTGSSSSSCSFNTSCQTQPSQWWHLERMGTQTKL